MTILKNIAVVLALLAIAGCGCGDDAGGRVLGVSVPFSPKAIVNPIRLPAPARVVPVDVLFVLDDSIDMQLSPIVGTENDLVPRNKGDTAQAIFANIRENLLAALQAANPGVEFDLAFGMARYEDYGGTWRTVAEDQSRPFVLNQPILREAYDQGPGNNFTELFAAALSRTAPGLGTDTGGGPDGETIFEALIQAATGRGFDGNDNGTTTDSGLPGVIATQENPGPGGDVPAVSPADFADDGTDNSDEPLFSLNGTPASGNEGGAGWRTCSLRFVITSSDFCAVAPFPTNNPVPPATDVISTTGAAGTPLQPDTQQALALACDIPAAGVGDEEGLRMLRFGRLPEPVAPANAATVQETIDALNANRIEVLGIGTLPTLTGRPVPTAPGGGSPLATAPPAEIDPVAPSSSFGPFTWMSVLGYLSGALDQSGDVEVPLVYDMEQVSPDPGVFLPLVEQDLAERVAAWLVFPPTAECIPVPEDPGCVAVTCRLDLGQAADTTGVVLSPLPASPGMMQTVQIPAYYEGQPVPPNQVISWFTTANRANPESNATVQATVPATVEFMVAPVLPPPFDMIGNPFTDAAGEITVVLPAQPVEGAFAPGSAMLEPGATGCIAVLDITSGIEDRGPDCDAPPSMGGPAEQDASTTCGDQLPTTPLVLSQIAPTSGPVEGGQVVTATGSGFQLGDAGAVTTITIGGAVVNAAVQTDTLLTFVTPASVAGTVDVTASNGNGTATLFAAYTYLGDLEPPTLVAVEPNSGPVDGGTDVVISGANFPGPSIVLQSDGESTDVFFDGVPATDVQVVSDTTILCKTPAHA
ncbi:MAG: IPT/TIG domain-containing protein, partial [Planctomycetota bacterium]